MHFGSESGSDVFEVEIDGVAVCRRKTGFESDMMLLLFFLFA